MTFAMFLGFAVGMLAGVIAAAFGMKMAQKKSNVVEEDERTALIKAKAGNLTFYATGILAYVGWVAENVVRHLNDQPVNFFSPWGIMLFAIVLIYFCAFYYESWKVSDNDAAPDDAEMKKLRGALVAICGSLVVIFSATASAGSSVAPNVRNFLIGFDLLLLVAIFVVLGRMQRRRRQTNG